MTETQLYTASHHPEPEEQVEGNNGYWIFMNLAYTYVAVIMCLSVADSRAPILIIYISIPDKDEGYDSTVTKKNVFILNNIILGTFTENYSVTLQSSGSSPALFEFIVFHESSGLNI